MGEIDWELLIAKFPVMRFFRWEHLPENLAEVSMRFGVLAVDIATMMPRGPETSVCLRKLLEAKDAGVRAEIEARALSTSSSD